MRARRAKMHLALDARRCTQGRNGEAWAWGFVRVVPATIVDLDEAVEIVRAVQLARAVAEEAA